MQQDYPIIRIRELWTQFGGVTVHQGLDLKVAQGEILAIVGSSGSGKTTLLRQMLGLQKPARGSIEVFGQDISGAASVPLQLRTRCGMLFQHGALFSALTAFDNVALPLRELGRMPETLVRDAALFKLHLVGIDPQQAQKMPFDLSGGMVKRVALARALILEPELLFLDEPTAGLDPARSESFVELIATLHQALRLTVVMVTHDLDTLFALATKVAVLAEKRVIACSPPDQIIRLEHPFIEQFFRGARGRRALEDRPHAPRTG